jgi:tRNA_anti-like
MDRNIIGLFLIALLAATGCQSRAPKAAKAEPMPEAVGLTSADQIWFDYEANPAAADGKYRDKYYKIVGRVHSVAKGDDGRYAIGFAVAPKSATPPEGLTGLPPNVVCRVAASSKVDFTSLSELQIIHVNAKIVGRKSADVWGGFVVEVVDARYLPE